MASGQTSRAWCSSTLPKFGSRLRNGTRLPLVLTSRPSQISTAYALVPEPASWSMLSTCLGVVSLATRARRVPAARLVRRSVIAAASNECVERVI